MRPSLRANGSRECIISMSSRRTPGPITTNLSCRWDCGSSFTQRRHWWLWFPDRVRGACHRARIRATRWLTCPGRRGFCTRVLVSILNNQFKMQFRIPAARCVRVFTKPFAQEKRGRRECRVPNAPAASRAKLSEAHERSHHGHTGNHPAFPAQWFYGFLRALPGDEFVLSPSSAD
jgi:hypothetical protein